MVNGVTVTKDFFNLISDIHVPIKIFNNNDLTTFESLVFYLKKQKKLTFKEISILLNRDQRNIWTVFNRAEIKHGR